MFNRKYFALFACLFLIILAACSSAAEEATPSAPVEDILPALVSATGVVVPEKDALLSISTGGIVEEVLVGKGDQVSSGQVLVNLEGSEGQLAAVAATELELLNAQTALEVLYKDTELAAAKALNDAESAERALEDLNNRELQQAQALQAVANAEKLMADAERNLTILTTPPSQNALDQAQGNILLAEKKLDEILDQIDSLEQQFRKYSSNKNLPIEIRKEILTKIRRALKGLDVVRTQKQLSLINARTRYNELLEPPDPVDVQVAEAELAAAQARLNEAEKDLERVLDGPLAGEIALLEAQIEKGRRDFETYSAGPDPDDLALAEARLANAEVQLSAARAAIADRQLTAPFEGVISAVYVNEGEWVVPGSPVLLVGDLDTLQVETSDLGEIDVAQIAVGDPAQVTFDALPDLILQGAVSRIDPKSGAGPGVSFPVIIDLDQIPVELRWGMTAFVDITPE